MGRQNRRYSAETRDQVKEMFLAGKKVNDISYELSVPVANIRYWLKNLTPNGNAKTEREEKKLKAIELVKQNCSISDAAIQIGVSVTSILNWTREHRANKSDLIQSVIMDYENKEKAKEIAEKHGISVPTVYNWIRKYKNVGSTLPPTNIKGDPEENEKGQEDTDEEIENFFSDEDYEEVKEQKSLLAFERRLIEKARKRMEIFSIQKRNMVDFWEMAARPIEEIPTEHNDYFWNIVAKVEFGDDDDDGKLPEDRCSFYHDCGELSVDGGLCLKHRKQVG